MRESDLQREVRIALAQLPDVLCWRNHCGTVRDERGQWHSFGLSVGSADLVGVLRSSGRFFALELKNARGRVAAVQTEWLAMIRRFGGFAAVIRSVDEALDAIDRMRAGASE